MMLPITLGIAGVLLVVAYTWGSSMTNREWKRFLVLVRNTYRDF